MHVLFRLYVCVSFVKREKHSSSFTNMTQKPLKTKALPSLETLTQRLIIPPQMTLTLSNTAVETSNLAVIYFVSLEDLYCSPGINRPGLEAYLSALSSTEVMDDCMCNSIPPVSLHVVHR